MESPSRFEAFSAEVRLELLVGGRTIPLAKAGPGYAVLRKGEQIRACDDAVLIMTVDGREHRWEIVLKHDVVPFDDRFHYDVKKYPQD